MRWYVSLLLVILLGAAMYMVYVRVLRKEYKRLYPPPPRFFVHELLPPAATTAGDIIAQEVSLQQRGIAAMRDGHNGQEAFVLFRRSLVEDYEPTSVLYIAELYAHGVHGSINPDKVSAARMYQTILDFASKFPAHVVETARQRYHDIVTDLTQGRRDTDVVAGVPSLPADFSFELVRVLAMMQDEPVLPRRPPPPPELHFMTPALRHHAEQLHLPPVAMDDDGFAFEEGWEAAVPLAELMDPMEAIARVQVAANNDTQNVHSSTVLSCAQRVQNSSPKGLKQLAFDDAVVLVLDACMRTHVDMVSVQRVLRAMNDERHAKFEKSDREIFCTMVSRIQAEGDSTKRDNLMEILARQLESGVERGSVVCSTGRIVRVLSVYDGVDDTVQAIVPEWALDQELGNLASRVRDSVLANAPTSDVDAYHKGESDQLVNDMRTQLQEEASRLYSHLVSSDVLQRKLDVYVEGF